MKALKKWFPLISLICGALALVMIFLPAGSLLGEDFKGTQIAFGDSDKYLEFSILNTLSFVIGVVGGVLAFLGAKSNNKVMKYAAIACFVLGVILFLCSKNFVQFDSIVPKEVVKAYRKEMEAGIGSILAAIFCVVGAAATACDTFIKE
jgi:hypothetical protein